MKLIKNLSSIGGIFLTILLVVIAVFSLISGSFLDDMCGNVVYKEYISPDHERKVVVFQRDCGATTGFSTHVSIIDANEELRNSPGNVISFNGQPEDSAPNIRWMTNSLVKIYHKIQKAEDNIVRKIGWFNPVEILYIDNGS